MKVYVLNVFIRGDTPYCQDCYIPKLPDDHMSFGRISASIDLDVGIYSSFKKAEERLRTGMGLLGHGDRFSIYESELDSLNQKTYSERKEIWRLSEDKSEWEKLYSNPKKSRKAMKKPTPMDPCYDIHEVTDYLNEKYGFTEKEWDEVIDKFADQLSNGCILTIERGNKLENTIVDEFASDDESVDISYWW